MYKSMLKYSEELLETPDRRVTTELPPHKESLNAGSLDTSQSVRFDERKEQDEIGTNARENTSGYTYNQGGITGPGSFRNSNDILVKDRGQADTHHTKQEGLRDRDSLHGAGKATEPEIGSSRCSDVLVEVIPGNKVLQKDPIPVIISPSDSPSGRGRSGCINTEMDLYVSHPARSLAGRHQGGTPGTSTLLPSLLSSRPNSRAPLLPRSDSRSSVASIASSNRSVWSEWDLPDVLSPAAVSVVGRFVFLRYTRTEYDQGLRRVLPSPTHVAVNNAFRPVSFPVMNGPNPGGKLAYLYNDRSKTQQRQRRTSIMLSPSRPVTRQSEVPSRRCMVSMQTGSQSALGEAGGELVAVTLSRVALPADLKHNLNTDA